MSNKTKNRTKNKTKNRTKNRTKNKTKNRTKNKTKNRTKRKKHNKSTKHIQDGGTIPKTIQALTYNLSWASQDGLEKGSEEDFVRQCKSKNRNCYLEALKKIKELHSKYKFDVIGIQEVQDVDLVSSICENTNLKGWYRGATWNSMAKVYSGCAIIWNTDTLGTMKSSKTINLALTNKDNQCDARTCCMVTTTKNIILIVAHFPWITNQENILSITNIINEHISSYGPIIILADTNDSNTLISKENPLIIRGKKLSHGLTKDEAQQHLKTCCWHEKNHKWPHMTDTGDYILSENVIKIGLPPTIKVPTNETTETNLYSDHMPVMATIELVRGSTIEQTRATKKNSKKGIRALADYEASQPATLHKTKSKTY